MKEKEEKEHTRDKQIFKIQKKIAKTVLDRVNRLKLMNRMPTFCFTKLLKVQKKIILMINRYLSMRIRERKTRSHLCFLKTLILHR